MTTATDPHTLPAATRRATAPRRSGSVLPPSRASMPTAATGARLPIPLDGMVPVIAPAVDNPDQSRALLGRLVLHTEALAALDITQETYDAWAAVGRGWRTWGRPDGALLADAAEVLGMLTRVGGTA